MQPRLRILAAGVVVCILVSTAAAGGQERDPDLERDLSQPDFAIITLPTTLRVPRHRLAFRLTHRFSRPLAQGDVGDLIGDFLGLDSAAQIGLEFRYGLFSGTQIGIHRTNEKTIQLFGQQDLVRQGEGSPVGVNALITVEGLNNFRTERSAGIGVVISRKVGDRGAIYAEPIWVSNTSFLPADLVDDDQTFMVGLGARIRVRPSIYVVGQVVPRVAGHAPDSPHAAFGIEKRAGGHTFQLNVSNALGTTIGQMARGGDTDAWFIGFNISRKFF